MTEYYLYRNKYIVFLIILLVFIGIPNKTMSQSREYLLKAGYIEKFIHFIEWPEVNNKDTIAEIGVIGEGEFEGALEKIFKTVKVNNKTVVVRHLSSVNEITGCMILIISNSVDKNILDDILKYTTNKPILTISEKKGYGNQGVIINLLVVDNFIRYEINQNTLEKSGLKMSSLLLNAAIIVSTNE